MMLTRGLVPAVFVAAWALGDSIGASGPAARGVDALAWLSGAWVLEKGGRRTEEHWTKPAGGTMFGVNRTIAGGRTVFFEYLRIEKTEEGVVYYASPRGRCPATAFVMTEVSDKEVVFENPEHDFPQRIIYRRQGDGSLTARIEGKQGGRERSSEWNWKQMTAD